MADENRVTRNRSENWLEDDKELLLELIRERVGVLENKNTDSKTNERKKNAWNEVLNSFNGLCKGAHRTVPQLKVKWGTAKMTVKEDTATLRRQLFQTDGGPQLPMATPLTLDTSSCLPKEFVVDTIKNDPDSVNVMTIAPPIPAANQASTGIEAITNSQIQCIKIQMENERKRGRNLDLQFEILQEELRYYKRKNTELNATRRREI